MNTIIHRPPALAALVAAWLISAAAAQERPRLVVKEVTVFKNGYGLVVAEGDLPVGTDGHVVYDAVPKAVLGAFWPTVPAGGPRLVAAAAERRPIRIERTVLDQRGLLLANIDAEVYVTEPGGARYAATIVAVLERSGEEIERTAPPDTPRTPAARGSVALLKTTDGIRPVPFDRLADITFRQAPKTTLVEEELRDVLTWRLDWQGKVPAPTAKVALAWLQKGLRWQSSYRLDLDGTGTATATLAATLINDVIDLDGAAINLVVGSPRMDFAGELDAMVLDEALHETARQARQQFDFGQNRLANFANVAQVVVPSAAAPAGGEAGAGDASDLAGTRTEDLYVFAVPSVALHRGGRLQLRVAEWQLEFRDIYKLDLKATPPRELADQTDARLRTELAKMLAAPKAVHHLRLTNKGPHPLTTGPAALFKDGRLLGQALLTYTAKGGTTDLAMADAVEIRVKREDRQTQLEHRVVAFGHDNYTRISFAGEIALTNFSTRAVELEVTRDVFGLIGTVENGEARQLEPGEAIEATTGYGYWGWSWPWWWHATNGLGRARWKLTLEPGKAATLKAEWAYYWR
jgi:hypothetical protein